MLRRRGLGSRSAMGPTPSAAAAFCHCSESWLGPKGAGDQRCSHRWSVGPASAFTHARARMHMHVHTCMHMHARGRTWTHTHTHMHTHARTFTLRALNRFTSHMLPPAEVTSRTPRAEGRWRAAPDRDVRTDGSAVPQGSFSSASHDPERDARSPRGGSCLCRDWGAAAVSAHVRST